MIDLGLAGRDLNNPLHAWEYIYKSWKTGEPLPSWVMDYLGPVAEKMITMKPATGRHAVEIKNALGFGDCRCFEAYHNPPETLDFDLMADIYKTVEAERAKRGHGNRGTVFADVGRHFFGKQGRPAEKTRKLYYQYKAMLEAQQEADDE